MNRLRFALSGLGLAFLFACGGGKSGSSTPAQTAKGLAYADPASGDYRLVRDASLSSGTKLVLDLVGPSTAYGRGIAFTFTVDSKADLVKVADTDSQYVQNGSVFDLGATSPKLLLGIKSNGTLDATIAMKGTGNAKLMNGVLARIALELHSATSSASGTGIPLSLTKAKLLPAIGDPIDIDVQAGILSIQ